MQYASFPCNSLQFTDTMAALYLPLYSKGVGLLAVVQKSCSALWFVDLERARLMVVVIPNLNSSPKNYAMHSITPTYTAVFNALTEQRLWYFLRVRVTPTSISPCPFVQCRKRCLKNYPVHQASFQNKILVLLILVLKY